MTLAPLPAAIFAPVFAPRLLPTRLLAPCLAALLITAAPALAQETAPQETDATEAPTEAPTADSSADSSAGPAGSPANEAAPPRAASEAEYVTSLVTHIRASRLDVSALRDAGLTGTFTTRVTFSTGHDGRLVSSRVSQSSGSPLFDDVAMAQLRAAEPFPLFAPDMDEEPRVYSIDIRTTITPPAPPAEAVPPETRDE